MGLEVTYRTVKSLQSCFTEPTCQNKRKETRIELGGVKEEAENTNKNKKDRHKIKPK